jgi:hypothetical protein
MSNDTLYVDAIGILGPGLPNWEKAQKVLRGEQAYECQPTLVPQPSLLPPNERRRAPPAVRIAFAAAEEAVRSASSPASELATVFASSDADMSILHRICTALRYPTRIVSPTDFHNSVHNAASGYWGIAAKSRGFASAIAAYDFSFAMGLLEAATLVIQDGMNTLMVVYDVPPPAPHLAYRPLPDSMAVAIALTPTASPTSMASLRVRYGHTSPSDAISSCGKELETLRQSLPPARSLPFLELLAKGAAGTITIECPSNQRLQLELSSAR